MERTARARELSRLSQENMAILLGIDQGRYKHYEGRSLLPHEFIPRFCLAARVSISWLFTGRD